MAEDADPDEKKEYMITVGEDYSSYGHVYADASLEDLLKNPSEYVGDPELQIDYDSTHSLRILEIQDTETREIVSGDISLDQWAPLWLHGDARDLVLWFNKELTPESPQSEILLKSRIKIFLRTEREKK